MTNCMKIMIHKSNTKLHVAKICLQLDLHNVNCDLNLHVSTRYYTKQSD